MYRPTFDWDDARVFLAVVRAGSLRAAARALGLSQPTVGRRIARFEADAGGGPLFDRLPEGLRPTAAGRALLPLAEQVEAAAAALQGQRAAAPSSTLRVSVGEWAGAFLAGCLGPGEGPAPPDGLAFEFVTSDRTVNLGRREADLAVRHGRPETGGVYVSRLGTIACAAYRARGGAAGDWISYTEEQAHYAQSRWIAAQVEAEGGRIAMRASGMELQAIAARAGAGRVILPCCVGDRDPALVRVGARIPALDAPHWLIVHRDLRRVPVVRAAMEWIRQVFAAHRAVLEGRDGA
ncbi:MAG: hypothetical protein BGO51_20385 [Rhodospirillales bacterium 69-11]|nr:MAG: hypothetical protein BGO51_20385 [Rhodospirillales bacterium 69-11]